MARQAESVQLDLATPKPWRRWIPSWLRSLIWLDFADRYDAFLSYSWKVDSKTAPVIHSALQRFLCPWYKLRAKTIFRDLSCLPAGSSLQNELFDRMDRSTHLIVLASPEAARSGGMDMEAHHWFSRPRDGQVLIIVTGGEFNSWDDVRHRALPAALRTNLASEPLWIPLQHRRAEILAATNRRLLRGQLIEDLKQIFLRLHAPRTWEELHGEERIQRRRALWMMSATASVLLVLAVVAAVFGVQANRQSSLAKQRQKQAEAATREAENQRNVAKTNAAEARRQEGIAKEQTIEADRQRVAAVHEAKIANSRRLATAALLQVKAGNVDLAALLGIEAMNTMDTFEARDALLSTIQANPMLRAYLHHSESVSSVAFSPDGKSLASASGAEVRLWDLATFQPLRQPSRCESCSCKLCSLKVPDSVGSIAFSPDGKLLALAGGTIIQFWDVATWQPLGDPLAGHADIVSKVAFSPDGKLLASASADRTIRLWNVANRQPQATLQGHNSFVYGVAFSPDGKMLASASADDTMRLWDVPSGQLLGTPFHASNVYQIALSPDGKTLVSGTQQKSGVVQLWDVASRQAIGDPLKGHTETVNEVVFSPNGKTFATASQDGTTGLWDAVNRRLLGALRGHKSSVIAVAFSPDGKLLASASRDKTVLVWDLDKPGPLTDVLCRPSSTPPKRTILRGTFTERGSNDAQLARSTGVAFSASGKAFVAGGADHSLQLWDVANWRVIGKPLRGHTKEVDGVAFSPNSKILASASYDQTVRLWDVESGQPLGEPLGANAGWVFSVAFSPDGELLASADGKAVRLWNVEKRQPLGEPLEGHTDAVWSVAFSPDSKMLASASVDTTIWLWNVATRKPIGESLKGHTDAVYSVAFSPDGKLLASGGHDHVVRLWDVAGRRMLGEPLQGHEGIVESVAFSPDGQLLASASTDRTIRLWDVVSQQAFGEPLRGHPDRVEHVAFSPDGNTLASAGGADTVLLWDLRVKSWVARLCRLANRNMSSLEWQQHVGPDISYHRTCPELPNSDSVPGMSQ